jgi:lipopolysaccharide assembly outer membrane protein LptD (OstA)
MRLLAVAAFLLSSVVTGSSQKKPATPAQPEEIRLLAESEIKADGTVKLRGHVEVISGSTTLYADEADYDPLTGSLNARGHVHIEFKKGTPSITIKNPSPEDVPVSSAK